MIHKPATSWEGLVLRQNASSISDANVGRFDGLEQLHPAVEVESDGGLIPAVVQA